MDGRDRSDRQVSRAFLTERLQVCRSLESCLFSIVHEKARSNNRGALFTSAAALAPKCKVQTALRNISTSCLSCKDAMPAAMQTTVERLDKPSAYYLGRVRAFLTPSMLFPRLISYSLFARTRSVSMVVIGMMMMLADKGHLRSLRTHCRTLQHSTSAICRRTHSIRIAARSSLIHAIQVILHH